MSLLNIIGGIIEIIDLLCHWRFTVCLVAGIAVAFAAAGSIAAEPLRWIVAGAAVVVAFVIGWRWDNAH